MSNEEDKGAVYFQDTPPPQFEDLSCLSLLGKDGCFCQKLIRISVLKINFGASTASSSIAQWIYRAKIS